MAAFLESITGMFATSHKGRSVGIDIGASSIKVVEVESVEERAVLRNYGELVLGPRAGVAAGQATSLSPEQLAEALNDLLHEAGIVLGHTTFAIPFNASLLSVIELPDVGRKDIESMVSLEARRYIPVPLSEVSLDWWVLPKRTTGGQKTAEGPEEKTLPAKKIEVILAAIHNEALNKYETIKRVAHAPTATSHMEIEIFSTLRAVAGRSLVPTLVIDVGAGSTKLILVDEGVVRGSHLISMGGQDVTIALSKSLGIPFSQAEEMKCRVKIEDDKESRDVAVVVELIIANIMNEAMRFAQNYEGKYGVKVAKVILVGGGARLKGFKEVATRNFPGVDIEVGDAFARLDTPAFLEATLKELSSKFAVAVGVALGGLEE